MGILLRGVTKLSSMMWFWCVYCFGVLYVVCGYLCWCVSSCCDVCMCILMVVVSREVAFMSMYTMCMHTYTHCIRSLGSHTPPPLHTHTHTPPPHTLPPPHTNTIGRTQMHPRPTFAGVLHTGGWDTMRKLPPTSPTWFHWTPVWRATCSRNLLG